MKLKKKIISLFLTGTIFLTGLTACDSEKKTSESLSKAQGSSDVEITNVETLFNPNFKIEVLNDGIKKVTDGDKRELVLVPKEISEVPEEYSNSIVVRTPVEKAVFLSSTQVCTFRTISSEKIINSIAAVSGNAETYSFVPDIANKIKNGEIIDVTGNNDLGEPDFEKIQSVDPDIVFVYGGDFGQQSSMAKFDELGINYAVDNDYVEGDYLARMEWMRFVLTFFDADAEITDKMNEVSENINEIKTTIEKLDKPVVAAFQIYDGAIYPTGNDSWIGTMLTDMGGINAFKDIDVTNVTLEAAFEKIQDADIIIYTGTPSVTPGMDGVKSDFSQLTECKAYDNGRVYQYDESYWNNIDQTDILAADLAAVFYPEAFSDRKLSYFVKLDK